jgi:hypothetical protein
MNTLALDALSEELLLLVDDVAKKARDEGVMCEVLASPPEKEMTLSERMALWAEMLAQQALQESEEKDAHEGCVTFNLQIPRQNSPTR